MNKEFALGKAYKLCSLKRIDRLFAEGQKLKAYPLTLMYQVTQDEMEHTFQVLFSVPKKRMKHAHDRNYVKRCLREILRLNKAPLEKHLTDCHKKINFALIYQFNERMTYVELEKKLIKALDKLILELSHEE